MSKLSLQQIVALGSHLGEVHLTMSTRSKRRSHTIKERYVLQWDGWERYRYQVRKGEFMVMDVTVWNGRAYQNEFGGRMRIWEDPSEMHYYLRQTWNQWNGATEAFKSVLVFEFDALGTVEGHPVEKYNIKLAPQIEPDPDVRQRLRQSVEHDRAEGTIWLDKETGVPLRTEFTGEYRVVRFSRRPGRPGEETKHVIEYRLRRHNLGQPQVTESPAVARSP